MPNGDAKWVRLCPGSICEPVRVREPDGQCFAVNARAIRKILVDLPSGVQSDKLQVIFQKMEALVVLAPSGMLSEIMDDKSVPRNSEIDSGKHHPLVINI